MMLRLLSPLLALGVLLAAAPIASADRDDPRRADPDRCGHLAQKHIQPTAREDVFLNCGERVDLPPHTTLLFKHDLEPPDCHGGLAVDGSNPGDIGYQVFTALFPTNSWHWRYYVEDGNKDVAWNFFIAPVVHDGRLVGVRPEIHNFTSHPRKVRVYFECKPLPPPKPK